MLNAATLERPFPGRIRESTRKVSYNDTDFTIPVLSRVGGYCFEVSDVKPARTIAGNDLQKTTLDELNTIWNLRRFQRLESERVSVEKKIRKVLAKLRRLED